MNEVLAFTEFASIPRLSREMVVTEKLDGTNSQVAIWLRGEVPDGAAAGIEGAPFTTATKDGIEYVVAAGSRNRWLTPTKTLDNFGFAQWVHANVLDLLVLGPGRHYGEWWGSGIQRGYGLPQGEKRFSLFNTKRWTSLLNVGTVEHPLAATLMMDRPDVTRCIEVPVCHVTPILTTGVFDTYEVDSALEMLTRFGSRASPGFMKPEGVVVYHVQGNLLFKKTIDKNDGHKGAK